MSKHTAPTPRNPRAWTVAVSLGIASGCLAPPAQAGDTQARRPGLWGSYSERRLTMPWNSLGLFFGPNQTPLLGQRYGKYSPDGGVSLETRRATDDGVQSEVYLRGGVAFGLSPHLEAGALFLSFRASPDFHYADFPVYLTYGWTFGAVDVGARLSFLTPVESSSLSFNPSVPLLIRLEHARIDTGVFVPIQTEGSTSVGLNVPVRLTYNIGPRFFWGIETGVYEDAFGRGRSATSSLGGNVGYTTTWGKRLVDLSARLFWDDFLTYSPDEEQSIFDVESFQVFVGASFHSKVM